MAAPDRPLCDLRIIAVEQYGAGPFGSQVLADLGAEVIKIEDPSSGGDVARGVGPYFCEAMPESSASLFFQGFNRNKRSLTLDLTKPAARDVLNDLVRGADAVTNNLRGDVPRRLRLTHADLASVNPRIVCAHLSGYGREGARASWPGYDYLMQAEAGYFALTGDPAGPPARMGLSIVDMMAGITMSLGVLAAVMQSRRSGIGRDVDVSLFDTALFNLNYIATWYLSAGAAHGRAPRSAHPSLTPCQTYRTRDGWIYLMCNKEKFWRRLCERIDRPDLAADPRFLTFRERLVHRDELTATLDTALAARTTEEWMAHFAGSVPAAPVRDVADALDSPFVASRAMLLDVPRDASGAGGTAYRTIAGPIRFSDSTPPNRPAPALGADTDAVLAELGYDADRIAALRRAGAIGVEPSVSEPRGGNEMARKQRKRPAEGRAKGTRRTIKPKPTTRTRAAIGDKRTIVTDPFSHVVVLMLENRSFDHVLGTLQGVIPTLDGVPPGASPRSNASADGKLVRQLPVATMRVEPDPRHGHESVLAQIAGDNAGFVRDYATHPDKPSPAQWQQVMACHPRGALPAIHALAEAGAICDRWFCSVPGPTWTNRLFAMSGTSQGRVEMPSGPFNLNIHRYDQPSVFRRIEEVGRRCRIFYGDFPLSLLLADRRSLRGARSLTRFENFAAAARDAESFPDLAWIEPNYLGPWANDDHPPHDSAAAQALIAEVYRALRANEALFRSTLLVITYDEHGGFYDHVKPPRAIPPDAHDEEFAFDRLGVRVPAVLVSPWLAHQVVNTEMDHCALLRALQKRWGLGDMGARVAAAPDLFGLLKLLDKPRSDMPALAAPRVLKKTVTRAIAPPPPADGLESSIMAFGEWLETRTPTKARGARIRTRGTDPAALASARVANFLDARARSRAPARRTGRRTP